MVLENTPSFIKNKKKGKAHMLTEESPKHHKVNETQQKN